MRLFSMISIGKSLSEKCSVILITISVLDIKVPKRIGVQSWNFFQ
jgi:hypothetical protein